MHRMRKLREHPFVAARGKDLAVGMRLIRFFLLLATMLLAAAGCTWIARPPVQPEPAEPLVPTAVPASFAPAATTVPEETRTDSGERTVAAAPPPLADPYSLRWRAGVGVPDGQSPMIYEWTQPRPGWYVNWSVGFTQTVWISGEPCEGSEPSQGSPSQDAPPEAGPCFVTPPDHESGMEFAPMVRTPGGELQPPSAWIAAAAAARPGHTWLIGNEPDVRWQDNATPEAYARAYHAAYHAIKAADPTAQVAIGGLSQITPLRLAYLDRVWAEYARMYGAPMPVDVWTMHAFVLQEKAGDWGVDLPPGFEDAGNGVLWGIDEHDDLALVEGQVRRMRAWMAEHGQQDKPLWITEYGILMPAGYGFDEERVRRFLLASYDLFAGLHDPELGYAADGDRLVQRWVWFSTGYDLYPTGDLFTRDGQPTTLMHALSAYLAEYAQ